MDRQNFPAICSDFSRSAFDAVLRRADLYNDDHLQAPSDFQGFILASSLFSVVLKVALLNKAIDVLPAGSIRNKIDAARNDFMLVCADRHAEVIVADLGLARAAALLPPTLRDRNAADMATEFGLPHLTTLIHHSLKPVIR